MVVRSRPTTDVLEILSRVRSGGGSLEGVVRVQYNVRGWSRKIIDSMYNPFREYDKGPKKS